MTLSPRRTMSADHTASETRPTVLSSGIRVSTKVAPIGPNTSR